MSQPVTRGELREELAKLEESLEQKLDQKLELWTGALLARMDSKYESRRAELSAELASHVRAANEEMRDWVRAFHDGYKDLPPRVAKLEATVFAPKRRRR
jgi:hypothetical protein